MSCIWRMRTSGDAEPVSGESDNCNSPVWTPDGRIPFERESNAQPQIWSMAADGTERKQLTVAGNNYNLPTSNDGRVLAWPVGSQRPSSSLGDGHRHGSNQREVANTVSTYFQPPPDGRRIAFTTYGAGRWTTLLRVPSDGGPMAELDENCGSRHRAEITGGFCAETSAADSILLATVLQQPASTTQVISWRCGRGR